MKKLINNPDMVVEDMLEGFLKAHCDLLVRSSRDQRAIIRRHIEPNKVGIVIGGGSGHKPAFIGYVGEGMADGVAVGNIFASPSPYPIFSAIQDVNRGKGVVIVYGNYSGDRMNFSMAAELAEAEGIPVREIIVHDDVASAPISEQERRRGIAGEFFLYKVVGAMAQTGAELDEVYRVGVKANELVRSMGVAVSPCSLPQTGIPSFHLDEGEMEIGLGVHGEPGVRRGPLLSAKEIALELVENICTEVKVFDQDVVVLVNGLGSTTLMELYIIYGAVAQELEHRGAHIVQNFVGEYITSLEMGGCSLTLMPVDSELSHLMAASMHTASFQM